MAFSGRTTYSRKGSGAGTCLIGTFWYVYDEGSQNGPFGLDAAISYLRTKDPARVYVWREGLDAWALLRDVPELAHGVRPKPPRHDAVVPEITVEPPQIDRSTSSRKSKFLWLEVGALIGLMLCAADMVFESRGQKFKGWDNASSLAYNFGYVAGWVGIEAFTGFISGAIRDAFRSTSQQGIEWIVEPPRDHNARFDNIVARHWRGEFPLWIAYWIFGFFGNIVIALIPIVSVAIFNTDKGYDPSSIFYASAIIWTGVVVVALWQMVGVWRSATRYMARADIGKKALWGGLAKVVVALGLLRLLGALAAGGVPQLTELYRVAFRDDPDIPAYSIRLMRDGAEAEIVGGFKYGLTRDFAVISEAAHQLKVVHLDSIGGRVGEGKRLFEFIRGRALNTYVSSKCLSACTLAFAGGRERFILKDAILGFHKGTFPGVSEGDFDSVQKDVFVAAGFDTAFIKTALSTPHNDMWRPSLDTLIAAKVVTRIADETMFAVSGLGANPTKDKVAADLAKSGSVFRAIQSRFPAQFDSLADEYSSGILNGKTLSETVEVIRSRLVPFITSILPMADDDVLIDYSKIIIDQYIVLNAKSPSACYSYASGANPQTNYSADIPKDLSQRELDVQERVVRTATKRDWSNEAVASLFAKLRTRLLAKGFSDSDFALLESSNVDSSKHAQYCRVAISFFREIGGLPPPESATLLRSIFASR